MHLDAMDWHDKFFLCSEIKDVRKKKERAKELEGIDMSNIVQSSRRRSAISFVAPPKPKMPVESEGDDAEDTDKDNDVDADDADDDDDADDNDDEDDDDDEEDDDGSQSEDFNDGKLLRIMLKLLLSQYWLLQKLPNRNGLEEGYGNVGSIADSASAKYSVCYLCYT
jgi:hypothetical protein